MLSACQIPHETTRSLHSLGGASGFAVDAVTAYIEFMELNAEALKIVLTRTLDSWT